MDEQLRGVVLVVNSREAERKNVVSVSRAAGFQVLEVCDVLNARNCIMETSRICVVIADEESLLEEAETLLHFAHPVTTPIIVIGEGSPQSVPSWLTCGAAVYISRPFTPTDLIVRIIALARRTSMVYAFSE